MGRQGAPRRRNTARGFQPTTNFTLDIMQLILVLAAVVIGIFFLNRKPRPAASTVRSTGTGSTVTNPVNAFFPGWAGFTNASLQKQTQIVDDTYSTLKTLSNNFGWNDGGANPDVSISGSSAGGVQSSGSGAGVPFNPDNYNALELPPTSPSDYEDWQATPDFGGMGNNVV